MTDQPNVTASPAPEHAPEILAAENEGLPPAGSPPVDLVAGGLPTQAAAAPDAAQSIGGLGQGQAGFQPPGGVTFVAPTTPPLVPFTPPRQLPSLGRIVIYRSEHHLDAPALITRVYSDTEVSVHVFRDDVFPHHASHVSQINPAQEGAFGWFWPPRV